MNKKKEYGGDGDYGGNDDGDDGTFLLKWFQMYALAKFKTMMVITKILKLPEWGNGRRRILITNLGPRTIMGVRLMRRKAKAQKLSCKV